MDFKEKQQQWQEEYLYSLEHVGEMVTAHMNIMKYFKEKTYENAFEQYMEDCRSILEGLEHMAMFDSEHREDYIEEMARQFVKQLSENSKGKVKKAKLEQYKIIMALYTIPMIRELKLDVSEEYVQKIHEVWCEENPDLPFQVGTYDELKDGFRKKQFCYITTAICKYQEKEDDCYELMMFRKFRDTYLRKQMDGESIIKEYYELAPQIIKQIEFLGEEDIIYPHIWEKYLHPCLRLLETDKRMECFKLYKEMIDTLKKQYCVICC